jgi:hypothetical protein
MTAWFAQCCVPAGQRPFSNNATHSTCMVIGKRPTVLRVSAILCRQLRSTEEPADDLRLRGPRRPSASAALCDPPRFKARPIRAPAAVGSEGRNQPQRAPQMYPTPMRPGHPRHPSHNPRPVMSFDSEPPHEAMKPASSIVRGRFASVAQDLALSNSSTKACPLTPSSRGVAS